MRQKDTMYLDGFAAFAGTGDEGPGVLRRNQIMPRGRAKIRDGRKARFEQEDFDSVLAHFAAQENEVAFLVNHGEDPKYGGDAVGWIKKLEQDSVGMFAYTEWEPEITPKIRTKKLRYVSPGFKFKLDAEGCMRPVYLREASLTNIPAIDGMYEAVATDTPSPDPIAKENQMDEKTIAALTEKQTELEGKFTSFIDGFQKQFDTMADAINAKVMPGLEASAAKSADAKLTEQRKEDAFTAVLDGATKEGRLTAAQREGFLELTAGNHNPESAAKFVATLPITAPTGKTIVEPAPEPDLKAPAKENHTEFMDRCVKYADDHNVSIVTAEQTLSAAAKK